MDVSENGAGHFLSLQMEDCSLWDDRREDFADAAASGRAPITLHDDDRVAASGSASPIALAGAIVFETYAERGDVTFRAYEIFLTRNNRCYTATFGSTDEAFEASRGDFRRMATGLRFFP